MSNSASTKDQGKIHFEYDEIILMLAMSFVILSVVVWCFIFLYELFEYCMKKYCLRKITNIPTDNHEMQTV